MLNRIVQTDTENVNLINVLTSLSYCILFLPFYISFYLIENPNCKLQLNLFEVISFSLHFLKLILKCYFERVFLRRQNYISVHIIKFSLDLIIPASTNYCQQQCHVELKTFLWLTQNYFMLSFGILIACKTMIQIEKGFENRILN